MISEDDPLMESKRSKLIMCALALEGETRRNTKNHKLFYDSLCFLSLFYFTDKSRVWYTLKESMLRRREENFTSEEQ